MNALTLIAGSLCWVVTLLMSMGLIAGASEDSISAAQAIVVLAIAVATCWAGCRLLSYQRSRLASC